MFCGVIQEESTATESEESEEEEIVRRKKPRKVTTQLLLIVNVVVLKVRLLSNTAIRDDRETEEQEVLRFLGISCVYSV